MKEGWKYVTLSSVCENLFAGGDVPKNNFSKQKTKEYSIPIISNGIGSNSLYGYTDIAKVCKKSVTISARGTIGYATVQSSAFYPIVRLIVAIPDEKVIEAEFLKYVFNSMTFQSEGAAIPQLTIPMVKNRIIPVPPLSEQQQIVDFLDAEFAKIDELKNQAEQSLQNTKDLFQAALKEMLTPKEGWVEKSLRSIGQTQTGTTPSKSVKEYYGGNIPFIRPSEINIDGLGHIDYDSEMTLTDAGVKRGRLFKAGSVLMVCIGATIGKVGYTEKDVSCNQQINVLTPSIEYDSKFIYYSMYSQPFFSKVVKEGSSAQATLPIINKGKWENLTVCIPSIDKQKDIVTVLDRLSAKTKQLQSNYTRTIQLCADLKQALLRQVFE